MATTNIVDGASHHRILIVENLPLVRLGLVDLISAESDLAVCGETDSTLEAQRLIEYLRPDLVVTAFWLRDGGGCELIRNMRTTQPQLPMLVYSLRDEALAAPRALDAGASGYVGKWEKPRQVLAAIRKVLAGGLWLSPKMRAQGLSQLC